GVGYSQQVLHSRWIQREGYRSLSFVNQSFQFLATAHAADEIDSLVSAHILDTENRIKHTILKNADIERLNSSLRPRRVNRQAQRIPTSIKVHAPLPSTRGRVASIFLNFKTLSQSFKKLAFR